jgi:hypothetical protein
MHLNRHELVTQHTHHSQRTSKELLPKISPMQKTRQNRRLMLAGLGLEKSGTARWKKYRTPRHDWSRRCNEGALERRAFSIAGPLRPASRRRSCRTRATPADIPVEWPTKSELAIDLKTGKILGPKIPDKLLARAGEAIEWRQRSLAAVPPMCAMNSRRNAATSE